MTVLNLFVMEDLPQLWAFIFESKKGKKDVVCKNSLNSQRVVSTEKKKKRQKRKELTFAIKRLWS